MRVTIQPAPTFRKPLFRLVCVWFLWWVSNSFAGAMPRLHDLAVLEDLDGTETIETIAARPASDFQPLPGHSFAGGYTRSVHWLRLTVSAPAGEWWLEALPPMLDDLRLYRPDPAHPGQFNVHHQGDTLPFAERELDYRGFIFKLPFPDAGTTTLYLRMETSSSSMLMLRLWTPLEFFGRTSLEYGLLFAGLTILLTVLMLNVNAWSWLRDPLTPWFIAYLLSLTALLSGNSGLQQQYFFPASASANNLMLSLVSPLPIAFGNAFYRRLFLVDRRQPLLYWTYESFFWLAMLSVPACLAGYHTEVMRGLTATVMPMTLLGCLLSMRLWRCRTPGGGMMLVANLISMLGIAAFMLFLRGHVAGGFMLMHSLQIASLGTILALQLAVGARYRSLHDAHIKADGEVRHEREMREQQGRFLSMLAHELRTSLSVLRMAFGNQPMTPKAVASAQRAMYAMSEVIERSIQAEKLADGSLTLETQPCDVVGLIETLVADSPVPQRFEIRAQERPTIYTDTKLLRVIVANLIDNAAKYAVRETRVVVEVALAEDFRLCITNAIDAYATPDPDRVFDKYYRSPQAHEVTGSGLGLYIARGIAKHLGGSLTYRPGEGKVRFELHLPSP
jgi:signal transduction histidine kinase